MAVSFTFPVTVDTLSGIEIAELPDKTSFDYKEDKDITGLAVCAVFSNGDKEPVYGYTVSGFTTDIPGVRDVKVTYEQKTAFFKISVGMTEGKVGEKDGADLTYHFNSVTKEITVDGPEISAEKPIIAAFYDDKGRILSVGVITASGGKVSAKSAPGSVKIFWVSGASPLCENADVKA